MEGRNVEAFPAGSEVSIRDIKNSTLRILLVEDDEDYAQLLSFRLKSQQNPSFIVTCVRTLEEGLECLKKESIEGVLLDLSLPDSRGLDTFVRFYHEAPTVPIVVLSNYESDQLALEAVKNGAQDYLVKAHVDDRIITRVMRYAVERKRIEDNLREAYEKLKEAQKELIQSEKLSALGRFAMGVAHEVKNPLGIILGATEFLGLKIKNQSDPDVQTGLSKIKESVQRANGIIQNLLEFSCPPKLGKEKVKPEEIINDTLELLKYRSSLANIKILKDFTDKGNYFINVDKKQMEQVLFNLLVNASEEMTSGGTISLKVYETPTSLLNKHANLSPDQSACVIEVIDTGPGISKENLSKVFEPFFTTKRNRGGIGLGLSIAKMMVENHQGDLVVESEPGKGTRFKILLPMEQEETLKRR